MMRVTSKLINFYAWGKSRIFQFLCRNQN